MGTESDPLAPTMGQPYLCLAPQGLSRNALAWQEHQPAALPGCLEQLVESWSCRAHQCLEPPHLALQTTRVFLRRYQTTQGLWQGMDPRREFPPKKQRKGEAFWNADSAEMLVLGESWSGACIPPSSPVTALLSREKSKTLCLLQGILSHHLHPDQYWLLRSIQAGTVY